MLYSRGRPLSFRLIDRCRIMPWLNHFVRCYSRFSRMHSHRCPRVLFSTQYLRFLQFLKFSRASLLSPSSARRAWYTILQDSEKKDSKCRFDILRTTFEFSEYVLNGSALPQEHDEESSKNAPAMPVAGFQCRISRGLVNTCAMSKYHGGGIIGGRS